MCYRRVRSMVFMCHMERNDLVASVGASTKYELSFAAGVCVAWSELGFIRRLRVISGSGLGNWLVAQFLEGVEVKNLVSSVLSFAVENHERGMVLSRLPHCGRWWSPWQCELPELWSGCFRARTAGTPPYLLFNAQQEQSAQSVCATTDLKPPKHESVETMFFSLSEGVDLLQWLAASVCPVSQFGEMQVRVGRWSGSLSAASHVDPLGTVAAELYYMKERMGTRLDETKSEAGSRRLLLCDAFTGSPTYESESKAVRALSDRVVRVTRRRSVCWRLKLRWCRCTV